MPESQNGWSANDRDVIVSYAIPGGKVALRKGAAGQVLAYVMSRWHREVEPLVWPGTWGYAERPVRGEADVLSNHASGTAGDCSAPRHPLGADPARSFTPQQIAAIHKILTDCRHLIRWGGDYTGRKDGMHVEVTDGVTEEQLDALWSSLSGQPAQHPSAAPAATTADALPTLQYGMRADPHVARFQAWSNAYGWRPALPLLPVTGNYLAQTQAVVRAAQAQCGVTGSDANGSIIGPRTKAAFAARGARW